MLFRKFLHQIGKMVPELLLTCFPVSWFERTAVGPSQASMLSGGPLSPALPVSPLDFRQSTGSVSWLERQAFSCLFWSPRPTLLPPSPPLFSLVLPIGQHSELANPFFLLLSLLCFCGCTHDLLFLIDAVCLLSQDVKSPQIAWWSSSP